MRFNAEQLWNLYEQERDLRDSVVNLAIDEWGKPWPDNLKDQPEVDIYTENGDLVVKVLAP